MTLLTRWEPFREFSTMQDRMSRMNRLFRESYSPEVPEEELTTTNFAPPVDIKIAFGVLVGSFGTRRMLGCFGFNLLRVTAAMEGLAALIRSQIGFQFYRSVANVAD
jgi:hypothetical protein